MTQIRLDTLKYLESQRLNDSAIAANYARAYNTLTDTQRSKRSYDLSQMTAAELLADGGYDAMQAFRNLEQARLDNELSHARQVNTAVDSLLKKSNMGDTGALQMAQTIGIPVYGQGIKKLSDRDAAVPSQSPIGEYRGMDDNFRPVYSTTDGRVGTYVFSAGSGDLSHIYEKRNIDMGLARAKKVKAWVDAIPILGWLNGIFD